MFWHCTLSHYNCPKGANISRIGFQKWAEMDWIHQRCFAAAQRAITSRQAERNHWRQSAANWPRRGTTAQTQLLCFYHTWCGMFVFFTFFLIFLINEPNPDCDLWFTLLLFFQLSNLQTYLNYSIYCNYIRCGPTKATGAASFHFPPFLKATGVIMVLI